MKKIILIIILISTLFVIGCAEIEPQVEDQPPAEEPQLITDFEECAAAGYPVMESYPRQCRANDETFVEEIDVPVEPPEEPVVELEQEPEEEPEPSCGDGNCDSNENCASCEDDCSCRFDEACYKSECKFIICGDDFDCNDQEACTKDICKFPTHPNSFCDTEQITKCKGRDDCCPSGCNADSDSDCDPVCGNDSCEDDEDSDNCPDDCCQSECGNQVCEECGEDSQSCPGDCY